MPDGSGPRKFVKLFSGSRGRGGMVPLAECRLRPLPRTLSILAALLGAGLLASACSEAPKLAKAPTSHPTTSEEKASPPPEAPEANKSDEGSPERAEAEESRAGSGISAARKARPSKSIRAATNRSRAQAHPRREQVRSRARHQRTLLRCSGSGRRWFIRSTARMSRAQPAKVLRRCNPKCHREARHRRAT